MPTTGDHLIAAIHATPTRLVLALTGGGAQALADLLVVPGASNTVLEATVPYSEASLAAFLGGPPDQACAEPTARAMAMAAFLRALRYAPADTPVAGIACTASLATDRPKRGPHRVHVALQTDRLTASWSLELKKGARSRMEEDRVAGNLVLNAVAEAKGLDDRLGLRPVEDESLQWSDAAAPDAWRDLLLGRRDAVGAVCHCLPDAGQCTSLSEIPSSGSGQAVPPVETRRPAALLPGAFHPLHEAHRGMARVGQEILGVPVEFELSIMNVDKPPLDYVEIRERTSQFGPDEPVWLTRLATFEEKSARFPGATFLVGVDTLRRIADPRYYGGREPACLAAIDRLADRGVRFLVFDRRCEGRLVTLGDLAIPPSLAALCAEVPPERFRLDVSSTEIRKGWAAADGT